MAPQVGQISEILKKWKMGHFQGYCSSRKNHPEMKRINFPGTLVWVDCKTPPNFRNRPKNGRLAVHSILGVFHKSKASYVLCVSQTQEESAKNRQKCSKMAKKWPENLKNCPEDHTIAQILLKLPGKSEQIYFW